MIYISAFRNINHIFYVFLIFSCVFICLSDPCMNFYLITGDHFRQGNQPAERFIGINIRQYNILQTVLSCRISIHSRLFHFITQPAQMLRLNLVDIHKRDHGHCAHKKQRQYQCSFHSQTRPSPYRGAKRYFHRRPVSFFRGKKDCFCCQRAVTPFFYLIFFFTEFLFVDSFYAFHHFLL